MSIPAHVLVSYLPAMLYLTVMTVAAVGLGRIPVWAHPALIVPGLVVRALTADNRADLAVAAAAGALLFVGGVFFLARVVSGATLFTVVGAFALAPLWWGYQALLPGWLPPECSPPGVLRAGWVGSMSGGWRGRPSSPSGSAPAGWAFRTRRRYPERDLSLMLRRRPATSVGMTARPP